jgi:hypothetical protein
VTQFGHCDRKDKERSPREKGDFSFSGEASQCVLTIDRNI